MLDLALHGVSVVISLPNGTDCKAAQLLVTGHHQRGGLPQPQGLQRHPGSPTQLATLDQKKKIGITI